MQTDVASTFYGTTLSEKLRKDVTMIVISREDLENKIELHWCNRKCVSVFSIVYRYFIYIVLQHCNIHLFQLTLNGSPV